MSVFNLNAHKISPQISGGGGSSRQLLLLIMILAALMPLPQARHLHDQVALDYAYDEDNSASSASSSASDVLPSWHVDPFHGLEQAFGEGSYDSDFSLSDGSYEEIAQAAWRAARRELRRQRIRHARSHNLRWFANSPQIPAWENPCGGVYQPDASHPAEADSSAQMARVVKKKHLLALRNNTLSEYQFVRNNAKLEYASYLHWQHEYKFLPNMTRPTNAVKLKTWYRNMQTFVGSFAYLGRAQYKYRKEHQQNLGASTFELHELLVSARNMLCEIETTINASYPHTNGAKLSRISHEAMMERLKFHTRPDGSQEASERDLRVSKELYLQYLDNMWKSLRRALRKQRHSTERRKGTASSSSSSSLVNVNSESVETGTNTGSDCGGSSGSTEC